MQSDRLTPQNIEVEKAISVGLKIMLFAILELIMIWYTNYNKVLYTKELCKHSASSQSAISNKTFYLRTVFKLTTDLKNKGTNFCSKTINKAFILN